MCDLVVLFPPPQLNAFASDSYWFIVMLTHLFIVIGHCRCFSFVLQQSTEKRWKIIMIAKRE